MNDLRDLLISRITDIQLLKENKTIKGTQTLSQNPEHSRTNQISTYSPNKKSQQQNFSPFESNCDSFTKRNSISDSPCEEVENQQLKSSNKLSFLVRKRQKFRNTKEIKLLLALNLSTFLHHKQIQQFYLISLQIFQAYDTQFTKYKSQGSFLSVSMQKNLKKIYSFFFLKHDEEESSKQFVLQVSRLQILDLSPSFFLGWIKKWSARLLHFHLNLNEDNNELNIGAKLDMNKIKDKILNKNLNFDIFSKKHRSNSFNFISQNKSLPQPSAKNQKQASKILAEKSFETKIKKILASLQLNESSSSSMSINSKQMVYSFCLDEIKGYYKNLPIEDLDYGYLRNMKKMGKKEQLIVGENSKNAVKVLLESKNSSIKVLTAKFESEYQRFRSGKSSIFIRESVNRKVYQKEKLQQNSETNKHQNIDLSILLTESPVKSLGTISHLNSKLLTPSIKTRQVYKKRSKQEQKKEDEILQRLNQKINSFKRTSEQLNSNSYQFKSTEIINYSKLRSWQMTEESLEAEDQKNSLKEMSRKKGGLQNGDKGNNYVDLAEEENNFPTENQNPSDDPIQSGRKNASRLPKLFAQHKLKKLRGKRHQASSKDRINRSQLVSSLNRQLYLKQQINTEQVNDLFSKKRIELQHPYSKFHVENINQRLSSETSEKQTLINPSDRDNQRSLSNFEMKSKFGISSKKETYNVIKYSKNKTAFKDSLPDLEIIKTVKNKLQDKNPFKHSNNTSKGISHSVKTNIFAQERISFESEDNKDQFVQYLKNLHREKIQNQIFQKEQQKQKQKEIRKKLS